MGATSNTFATVLANFITLQNNAISQLQQISQATTSLSSTVNVTQTNSDGSTSSFSLPSFGFLKSSIDRIDSTLSTLLGFDGSSAYIRLPDGSFKQIYQAINVTDPTPIGSVTVPANFVSKNNWFFDTLLSPLLQVSIDVSNYVSPKTASIYVKKMILNLDTQTKIQYFNTNIKGNNNIDYVSFLIALQQNNITYFLDEGVNNLPLSIVRYTGDFIIVNSQSITTSNTDGTSSTDLWYLLNTLKYNDNLSLNTSSMSLKTGDKLLVGESIYQIKQIDLSTNLINLTRISGYDPLVIGESVNLYSEIYSPKLVNINIGINEYAVLFFRNINNQENLVSSQYSKGVGFFTNNLNINLSTGPISLIDFYNQNVQDYGSILQSAAKDPKIPAVSGVVPNAPTLNEANFQVVSTNDHLLNQTEVQSIKQQQSDKVRLAKEISELQVAINSTKEQLYTTKFNSDTERSSLQNQLTTLINQQTSDVSLYSSIIQQLATIAQNQPGALSAPTYEIRGFIAIPDPVQDLNGNDQHVVQLYTYYRKNSPDGNSTNVKQFDFIDQNGSVTRGSFSNLNLIKSELRKKIYDPTQGKYVWDTEDVTDPNIINMNQINIPIENGETIDFYVVAVSEAGWPENPLLSQPSNTISITFPTNLVSTDEATLALTAAAQDVVRVNLQNDLAAKGLDSHLASSFSASNQYYAHTADVISSNFFDNGGNVINLYNFINNLQNQITALQNTINNTLGIIDVYIVDEENKTTTPVKNGDTVNLFAGYYTDIVNTLPSANRRGSIVSKVYKLYLQNNNASPLQMVSRLPGGIAQDLPSSGNGSSSTTASINDTDYNVYRRYDCVPIGNSSIHNSDTNNANKLSTAFYQSGQLPGQFLYSRYTDIGLVNKLYTGYAEGITGAARALLPSTDNTYGTQNWIWNWINNPNITAGTTAVGNGYQNVFAIHIDHPAIKLAEGVSTGFTALQTPTIAIDKSSGNPLSPEVVSAFRHSYGFNNPGNKNIPGKQLEYRNNWRNNPTAGTGTSYIPNITEIPDKFGFTDNDRYLIGSNTCGSYLFISPSTYSQLLVNGVDARASFTINPGENSSLVIPIIFQYRMTDYFGPSVSSTTTAAGNGIVGGYNPLQTVPPTNLTYVKQIGLDLYQYNQTIFSFDIQVAATYQKDSLVQLFQTGLPSTSKNVPEVTYSKSTIKTIFS